MAMNRRITISARPVGAVKESDFRLLELPVPQAGPGQVLVRTIYLSLDPYQRGVMGGMDPATEQPIAGAVIGRVEASNSPAFKTGDVVDGRLGWQDYAVAEPASLHKIDPSLAPLTANLGVLGSTGLSAYFGLFDVGLPRAGDTVVVSGAAGAVGMVAGQLAKIAGCRVVGIAGGQEKLDDLAQNLGFDAVINYRTQDVAKSVAAACPNGVDVYFDNVGGVISQGVFDNIAVAARIVICGQVSQYNLTEPETMNRSFMWLLMKRARIEGFSVAAFAHRFDEGRTRLARWLKDGSLQNRETMADGLENAPSAFMGMMQGKNLGKQILKVSGE